MNVIDFWGELMDTLAKTEALVAVNVHQVFVLTGASCLAEISVKSPLEYLFSLSNKIFSGSKYPKKHFI